jgi:hypothetical protein
MWEPSMETLHTDLKGEKYNLDDDKWAYLIWKGL